MTSYHVTDGLATKLICDGEPDMSERASDLEHGIASSGPLTSHSFVYKFFGLVHGPSQALEERARAEHLLFSFVCKPFWPERDQDILHKSQEGRAITYIRKRTREIYTCMNVDVERLSLARLAGVLFID